MNAAAPSTGAGTPRVLLVNPGGSSWASIHPPMHLGTIASFLLRDGVEVRIADENAGQDVARAIRDFDPAIVGITVTTPLAPDAYRIAELARRMGKLTVMGGKHATILTEEALRHVDIVVRHEGEQAMLDIVRGERSRVVERPYIRDLDDVPAPAWSLLDMEFYLRAPDRLPRTHLAFLPRGTRAGGLMTSRGCPYECIFCYNSWRTAPIRFQSAERTVADIRELVDRYRVGALFFMDDDFFCHRRRAEEICNGLLREKIRVAWGCQSTVHSATEPLLRLAKEAGLRQVGFGFESGSQRILSMLKNSRSTLEENREALARCRRVGVRSFASYMIGNPTETRAEIEETRAFMRANPADDTGVMITTPFPGTRLWEDLAAKGRAPVEPDWRLFTTANPTLTVCDDVPFADLVRIRDEMEFEARPMTVRAIFQRVASDPRVLFQAVRQPGKLWRALRGLRPGPRG